MDLAAIFTDLNKITGIANIIIAPSTLPNIPKKDPHTLPQEVINAVCHTLRAFIFITPYQKIICLHFVAFEDQKSRTTGNPRD